MQLSYTEHDDFIVVNKAFGLRTHRVSDGQFGFIEFLNEKLNSQELYVVHRLDKETSGLMLFAKSKVSAQKLASLFESHQIKKTYYFLTDRKVDVKNITIKSHIDRLQNQFVNRPGLEPNSETELTWIEKVGQFDLWKAHPKTGKPHQIRLHAEQARIPILGDKEHNGSAFFRLALTSTEMEFHYPIADSTLDNSQNSENSPASESKHFHFKIPLTGIFNQSSQYDYASLLEECLIKRNTTYKLSDTNESFRLCHEEAENIRADLFNQHLWIYDYSKNGLTTEERKSIETFAEKHNFKLIIRHMLDRGHGVGGLETSTLDSQTQSNWVAKEEGISYLLKLDSGFSPGLFLDQRENRLWIRNNSENKTVLNLFSYTSGFSCNAAIGKASEVTTVDVSSKFLDWSKENFTLNQLDPEKYEFFSQDCIVFLKGSLKRNRKWDLIICDPPTFGRSKDGIWKLEKDLPQIALLMVQCLNPKGKILFTCNYEGRTREEILELFTTKLSNKKFNVSRLPMLSLDYELTDDLKNLMKGFFINLE